MVAAAAPPAAMIEGMERMGWEAHPRIRSDRSIRSATVCAKQEEWRASISALAPSATAARAYAISWKRPDGDGPADLKPFPDGETLARIMFRGTSP